MRAKLVLTLTLLVSACGGGGLAPADSNKGVGAAPPPSSPPVTPTPSDFVLQYPAPQIFTLGAQAVSDLPQLNYTGSNHISVSPPLPAGLVIDANTGVITGIPTVLSPAATYTVTVENEVGGPAQATVVIEVNDGPFFYSSPAIVAPGSAMAPLSPRGAISDASYSVMPALPSGLSIDASTGVISGTPTSAQPLTYYQVSAVRPLLTVKYGLTLGVIDLNASTSIPVSNVSTLACAYSGGFIGTYVGNTQSDDEGLIAIAFTPDGNAQARVLDLSTNAVQDSDGLPGLSANLDGSFAITLAGSPAGQITGQFSGQDFISGNYESNGVSKPFKAGRLGGSASAQIRFTGGFRTDVYPIDFGVLDRTDDEAVGIGYQFSNYRELNWQFAVKGTFSGNTFNWLLPYYATVGSDDLSSNGLGLKFGDIYDGLEFETQGCRLN